MTKDVVISVRGLQVMDNESAEDIETVQQGEYYERNGGIFLLYDEYYEGFDEPVKNVMKIKGNEMTLTKRGIINVQMNFEAGKKSLLDNGDKNFVNAKEKMYDKFPLTVHQMDIIIGVLFALIALFLVLGVTHTSFFGLFGG